MVSQLYLTLKRGKQEGGICQLVIPVACLSANVLTGAQTAPVGVLGQASQRRTELQS